MVTATVAAVDRFGWTMFGAMERKQISTSVDTTAGADTTVCTVKTSLSHATYQVLYKLFAVQIQNIAWASQDFPKDVQ